MGCFESKPYEPIVAHETVTKDAVAPISEIQKPLQRNVEATAIKARGAVRSEQRPEETIVSVLRPEMRVGEQERAELKVKNLRDKLQSQISLSEEVLKKDGVLALRMKQDGKLASARMLIRKRKLTQSRIANCEVMLSKVMDTIDTMETAKDNVKFVNALEQGTTAINEITKDLSAERVQSALDSNDEALEYVKYIGSVIGDGADTMTDEQVEDELQLLAQEFESQEVVQSGIEKVAKIPEVPTEVPKEPVVQVEETKEEKQEEEELVPA
ncbi:Charged multivesicular body protein 6 [Gracilariopsis chorda]|uniref:Charged multivesicular body protein 6 n=1 Tax=Gracilariopsis chorda TaxID=448386 RepID=A0A2V3IT41_9FLOR|nr:Charged multivesicular body protein 6 [Gracilariopsis chorda]|eukprot:PXF45269.1 Charged multivesicular body protein 6 [Gracilariopsis chorda]